MLFDQPKNVISYEIIKNLMKNKNVSNLLLAAVKSIYVFIEKKNYPFDVILPCKKIKSKRNVIVLLPVLNKELEKKAEPILINFNDQH